MTMNPHQRPGNDSLVRLLFKYLTFQTKSSVLNLTPPLFSSDIPSSVDPDCASAICVLKSHRVTHTHKYLMVICPFRLLFLYGTFSQFGCISGFIT